MQNKRVKKKMATNWQGKCLSTVQQHIYIYILMLSWWRRRRSFEQSWPSSRWAQRRFCPSPSSVSTQWPLLVPTMLGRNHGIKPFEWTNPGWLKGKHIYLNSYSLGRKNSGPILPKIGCHPFFWKNITIWVFLNMLPHNLSFFFNMLPPCSLPPTKIWRFWGSTMTSHVTKTSCRVSVG